MDVELAKLLARHHETEVRVDGMRDHVMSCECCMTISRMLAGIRSDVWMLLDQLRE